MAHIHNVVDADAYFIIDPTTRMIACGATNQKNVMQYDCNSERITFMLPRYIEEHDMLTCNSVCVHYSNIASNKKDRIDDVYRITDLAEYEGDYLVCSWLMEANSTRYAGMTSFVVTFCCINGDTVEYAWSAASDPGINILPGKNNNQLVIENHSDLVNGLIARISGIENAVSDISERLLAIEQKLG